MTTIQLFDKTKYEHGYIDTKGELIPDDNFITTLLTTIYPSSDINYSGVPKDSYISFYDQQARFIERVYITDNNKITPPKAALHIRVTIPKDTPTSILENYNFWKDPFTFENNFCHFDSGTNFNTELRGHNIVFKNNTSHKPIDYPLELNIFNYKYYETQSHVGDTQVYYQELADSYAHFLGKEHLLNSDIKMYVQFDLTSMRQIELEVGLKVSKGGSITYTNVQQISLQGTKTLTFEFNYTNDLQATLFTPYIKFPKYLDNGFTLLLKTPSVSFDRVNKDYLKYYNPIEDVRLTVENDKIVSNVTYDCSYIIETVPGYNMLIYNYLLDFTPKLTFTDEYPVVGGNIIKHLELPDNLTPNVLRVPKEAKYLLVHAAGDRESSQRHDKLSQLAIHSFINPMSNILKVIITQDVETYVSFRDDIYQWMKETLSPNLTKGDLDIIIRLMCYIFGDLTGTTEIMKHQIDVDLSDDYYLKHLCTVIGYEWNNALTAEQQRESIKLFIELRKKRGTTWSIENLIRSFGQDSTSYYSTSDLRGVKVIEYTPNDPETMEGPIYSADKNGLYPGDLLLEVPQFSSILRFAIDNIRLIGTRIIFCYVIYMGIFKMHTTVDAGREIHQYFDPAPWGYSPIIKDWGPQEFVHPNLDNDKKVVLGIKNLFQGFQLAKLDSSTSEPNVVWEDVEYTPDKDGIVYFTIDDFPQDQYTPHLHNYIYAKLKERPKANTKYTIIWRTFDGTAMYNLVSNGTPSMYMYGQFSNNDSWASSQDMQGWEYHKSLAGSKGGKCYRKNLEGRYTSLGGIQAIRILTGSTIASDFVHDDIHYDLRMHLMNFGSKYQSSAKVKIIIIEGWFNDNEMMEFMNNYPTEPYHEWHDQPDKIPVDGTLQQFSDWFLTNRVHSAVSNAMCAIYIKKVDPYNDGPVWQPADTLNTRGFLVDEETLNDDYDMYS